MSKFNDAAFDGDIKAAEKWIEITNKQKNKIKVFAEPLSYAAMMGHIEIVKLFLQAGADINYVLKDGTTLHYAIQGTGMPAHLIGESVSSTEVAKLLIEVGADLSATDNPKKSGSNGWTPLMMAACFGRISIAKMLIEAGSNINAKDAMGCTPLMIAADFGAVSVAELLIQAGAIIDTKDSKGVTAFGYVARDVEVGATALEEELRPMQAFKELSEEPMGNAQTMVPKLFDLLENARDLDRARRGKIARMLLNAGASEVLS
jgi:ankyrin repeat protein